MSINIQHVAIELAIAIWQVPMNGKYAPKYL